MNKMTIRRALRGIRRGWLTITGRRADLYFKLRYVRVARDARRLIETCDAHLLRVSAITAAEREAWIVTRSRAVAALNTALGGIFNMSGTADRKRILVAAVASLGRVNTPV